MKAFIFPYDQQIKKFEKKYSKDKGFAIIAHIMANRETVQKDYLTKIMLKWSRNQTNGIQSTK